MQFEIFENQQKHIYAIVIIIPICVKLMFKSMIIIYSTSDKFNLTNP